MKTGQLNFNKNDFYNHLYDNSKYIIDNYVIFKIDSISVIADGTNKPQIFIKRNKETVILSIDDFISYIENCLRINKLKKIINDL